MKSASKNFIRNVIEDDLKKELFSKRRWSGKPGPYVEQSQAKIDNAKIRTRFPPEPNGHLHIGHVKSIFLNYGLSEDYSGVCHLRFDDTNPEKEDKEFINSIIESIEWLGFTIKDKVFYASDYFDYLYQFAVILIQNNLAYVDSINAQQIKEFRGTLTTPGENSPYRSRKVEENLELFEKMKVGLFNDGDHVLRLKIDMKSPNINMRDPVIYRIKKAKHHRTNKNWCIFPMYDYTHCISDALENITHSICTLEFEDHRPLYNWILNKLKDLNIFGGVLPKQYEFSRLNLTHTVLSKRKLVQLVNEKKVEGWDDPRLPTLKGAIKRGYSREGFKIFTERVGVTKVDSWIDFSILEDCMRNDLNKTSLRKFAVLNPLKLVIENFPKNAEVLDCKGPNHPKNLSLGSRRMPLTKEIWIEKDDFLEDPPPGYFRLSPNKKVRLRFGYVIECIGIEKNRNGEIMSIRCNYYPDSKSGTPNSNNYKVKGNIHWLSIRHAVKSKIVIYDRLFKAEKPGTENDFILDLNKESKKVMKGYLEPSIKNAKPNEKFQLERHGYFILNSFDKNSNPVLFRTVTLKDSWKKS